MEKLHKRSDGYSETPSGLFATVMQRYTGVTRDGQNYHFTARLCPTCEGTRFEWPVNTSIMLLQQDLVFFLEGKGYARGLSQEEVDRYNEAVDAFLDAASEPVEPGASPIAGEGENAPEAVPEGEGGASEEEPPPGENETPGSEGSGEGNEPPVATDGDESGASGETPPAEASGTEEQASKTKAKKG